jgi:hypothetical protein
VFEKAGKYFADWRDSHGTRKRKSFRTRRAALQFEAEQKELANPKPKAQGRPSLKFYAPITRAKTPTKCTTIMRQKPSSPLPVHARRKNSAPRMSQTSR